VRGRVVFGELVPFGQVWRLGANEPTRLHTSRAIDLGGVAVPAGRYSLYAIPWPDRWELFVTRSTFHWGNQITPAVRAREIGVTTVPVEQARESVETLTITPEPAAGDTVALVFAWERTVARVPVALR